MYCICVLIIATYFQIEFELFTLRASRGGHLRLRGSEASRTGVRHFNLRQERTGTDQRTDQTHTQACENGSDTHLGLAPCKNGRALFNDTTFTYCYLLLSPFTYFYLPLPTITYYYLLLPMTPYYYLLSPTITYR